MDFSKIQEIRIAKKMTQNELAQKVGVTREHVSAIENGRKVPSISLLQKIADVLACLLVDLLSKN